MEAVQCISTQTEFEQSCTHCALVCAGLAGFAWSQAGAVSVFKGAGCKKNVQKLFSRVALCVETLFEFRPSVLTFTLRSNMYHISTYVTRTERRIARSW